MEVEDNSAMLRAVLAQKDIPVVFRSGRPKEKLRVWLPYAVTNRAWLQGLGRIHPVWDYDKKRWEIPKSWFNGLVEGSLKRFRRIYIIQPYNEQEKCAPACMNAAGHICECSCMGQNHGAGNDGSWFEVSETFATRWNKQELACRLLTVE